MRGEHIAAIIALHAQSRAPEFAHRRDVFIPAPGQGAIEDRREHGIAADLRIKALDQRGDRLLREVFPDHLGGRDSCSGRMSRRRGYDLARDLSSALGGEFRPIRDILRTDAVAAAGRRGPPLTMLTRGGFCDRVISSVRLGA
jgi:hypothetical protein